MSSDPMHEDPNHDQPHLCYPTPGEEPLEIPDNLVGPAGSARRLPLDGINNDAGATVAWWLLTGGWHPLWPQFSLSVVHLRPLEGRPPAHLQFEGATHELLVLALNPGSPPRIHRAADVAKGLPNVGGYLTPPDVVHQFTATDEEMVRLASLCAYGCVGGLLNPSTDDSRRYLREQWLASCLRTLAHIRGEVHAR